MNLITIPLLILLSLLVLQTFVNKNTDQRTKRRNMIISESGSEAFMEMKYIDGFNNLIRERQIPVIFYEDKLIIDRIKIPIQKIKQMDIRFGNQLKDFEYNKIKDLTEKGLIKKSLGSKPGDGKENTFPKRFEDVILFTFSYFDEREQERLGLFVFDEDMLINKSFGIKLANLSEAVAFLTCKHNLKTSSSIIEEKKNVIEKRKRPVKTGELKKYIKG